MLQVLSHRLCQIPLYSGADVTLVKEFVRTSRPHHGDDGFGDADLPPIEPKLQEEDAVSAIIRLANEHEKGITISNGISSNSLEKIKP